MPPPPVEPGDVPRPGGAPVGRADEAVVDRVGPAARALAAGDDAYLVARAREDYPAAYEELVRRHQGRAYTLAVRMLGDRGDAQDVVQDALVKAWAHLPGFDGRSSFSTWLHRIVVNECLSSLRRRRPVPSPEDHDVPAPERTEQVVEDLAREDALRRGVQGLPVEQRAALVLTTFLGHTYDEAASVLGIPESTLRGRVARARRALLVQMEGWS